MKKVILLVSMLMASLWGEVRVSLSKEKLSLNESFSVDFIPDNHVDVQPDFSPLQADFAILSQGQNQSTTVINGRFSTKLHWTLKLRPKRAGNITIPGLNFGKETSPPVAVEVSAQPISKQDNRLLLETTLVRPTKVYEQTELVYIIRLYRTLNLASGSLSKVVTSDPDALIEPLGTDREYEVMHANGVRYLVLERKYTVVPQHAGELTIAPTVFEGEVVKGDMGFFNVQTEYRRLSSAEEKIQVNTIPPPFQKDTWFPAKTVTLSEQWSQDVNQMVAGDPITWTVQIKAEGCRACHIPDLPFNFPSTFKHYLDKSEQSNVATDDGFTGMRQFKVALIGQEAGEVTLPALEFKWWNLKTNQVEVATIPSRQVTVQGKLKGESDTIAANIDPLKQLPHLQASLEGEGGMDALPSWVYMLLALNALWMANYLREFYLKRKVRRGGAIAAPPKAFATSRKDKWQFLQHACEANDVKLASTHLLQWCRTLAPAVKFLNLQDVKLHFPSLEAVVEDLNAYLYGTQQGWQGAPLWHAVKALKPLKSLKEKEKPSSMLNELYPK